MWHGGLKDEPCGFRHITPYGWISQSEVFATNSGLFIHGEHAYLVDPGISPAELTAIADFLTERGATAKVLILTHAHWDHLLGPANFPEAVVVVQQRYDDVLAAHGADLQRQVARWQQETPRTPPEPFTLPHPTLLCDQTLGLRLGPWTLQVIAAPGHAPDHLVIYEATAGLLWAGDMLSDLEVPMAMHSLAAYEATLASLSSRDVRILVPGHGTPTTDPQEIRTRFDQDRAYLAAVRRCVTRCLERGADLRTTLASCHDIPFAQPDDYPNAHRWNLEQAYLEFGGQAPESGPVGWVQDWV